MSETPARPAPAAHQPYDAPLATPPLPISDLAAPPASLSRERAEKEYADLSQNMRHYGSMRFAQLTLFSAITAGLAKVAQESAQGWPVSVQAAVCGAGALVAAAFWVMEERAADYWHHFRRRANALEASLGYRQYSTKQSKRISATNAVRSIFLIALLAWLSGLTLILAR